MKTIAYFLLALGFGLGIFAYSMDTTVDAGGQTFGSGEFAVNVPKSRVYNVGLMEDRRLVFYAASLSLVLGTAFLGIATITGAKPTTESRKLPAGDPNSSLIERFTSGSAMSTVDVQHLAVLATGQPRLAQLTSRTNGDSLLHLAAKLGIADAVKPLLRAGANRAQRNGNGQAAYQLVQDTSLAERLRPEA